MNELICDICGTSYPDTEDRCPTCGYSRAFEAKLPDAGRTPAVREKIRGGRYSHKNVLKRRKLLEETENQEDNLTETAEPEPVCQAPGQAPEPEARETEEEKQRELLRVYRRDVGRNLAVFFSAAILLVFGGYACVRYGVPYLKSIKLPVQAVSEMTGPDALSTDVPTQVPTDAPTEAPTAAPTEAPTQAPTEAPTQIPSETVTEEATELLDVELELNFYEWTFLRAGQMTQLDAGVIPNEDITWISDNTDVVTVSDTGLVTAVGYGTAMIHAIYGQQELVVSINCEF